MSFCEACISGVRHEGQPEGKLVNLGGVETYVALPPDGMDYPKDKAVLFFTDVFGVQLNNNKLLADDYARNGFQTYMPDYFEGEGIPENAMNNPDFDRNAWFAKHGFDVTNALVDKVLGALKEKGITKFAAMGYCYGAPAVIGRAQKNIIHTAIVSHPSRLNVPADFEALLETSNVPLLINACEEDAQFPIESQKIVKDLLGDGKYKPGFEMTYWEGAKHGFAVRGDMSDPKVKAAKEGSFKASVEFLIKHL